jgi:hypothetical protein
MQYERWIDKVVEVVERLYKLVRPQAHNRIAWIVVLSGIALCVGPVWEPYARAAAKAYFNLDVPESPGFWGGVLLITLGLSYHLLSAFIQLRHAGGGQTKNEDHDAAVYKGLRESLSDRWFIGFLDLLSADHSYHKSESMLLYQSIRYLDMPSNKFLIADIHTAAEALLDSLDKLAPFLAYRFVVYPVDEPVGANTRYCMQPNHNVDRDWDGSEWKRLKYDEWTSELNGLIEATRRSYRHFVECTHKHLGKAAMLE